MRMLIQQRGQHGATDSDSGLLEEVAAGQFGGGHANGFSVQDLLTYLRIRYGFIQVQQRIGQRDMRGQIFDVQLRVRFGLADIDQPRG